jgi:rhodanese-related sulfurtransferase
MSVINIEPSTLNNWKESKKISLIDVRNNGEVSLGIIDGAIHVPVLIIPQWLDGQDKEACYVFYCHSGIRSENSANLAEKLEYANVYNLSGGVLAWQHSGFGLVKQ